MKMKIDLELNRGQSQMIGTLEDCQEELAKAGFRRPSKELAALIGIAWDGYYRDGLSARIVRDWDGHASPVAAAPDVANYGVEIFKSDTAAHAISRMDQPIDDVRAELRAIIV
jgi:hypothetical protein